MPTTTRRDEGGMTKRLQSAETTDIEAYYESEFERLDTAQGSARDTAREVYLRSPPIRESPEVKESARMGA